MISFIRFISHEFKTPTIAIIATLQSAEEIQEVDPELAEYLKICKISSKQILYLSHNLMDYNALCADQFIVNKQSCQLAPVIEECELMIRILAERKGLNFIVEMSSDLPDFVYIDTNRLIQVLLNLLINAIKFTKEGYIILKV